MKLTSQIAKNFREIYFGGNWTYSCLSNHLKDVTWQQAITKVEKFNTIATLVYHSNYYVNAVIEALKGNNFNAIDKESFNHTPIHNQKDWEDLLNKVWAEAKELAELIEELPEEKLWQNIGDDVWGNYYRNIHGIIEHTHYHLGQIVLIKKLLKKTEN